MCGRFYRFETIEDIAILFSAQVSTNGVIPPTYNAAPESWQPVIRLDLDGNREVVLMRWGLIPRGAKDDRPAPSNARSEGILGKWPFLKAIRTQRCLLPVNGFYEWRRTMEDGTKQPYAIGMIDASPYAIACVWDEWTETAIAINRRINSAMRSINKARKQQGLEPIGQEPKDEMEGTLFAGLALPEPAQTQKPEADLSHPDLDPTPRTILTFATITCDPNELIEPLHDRMPVILAAKDYDRWLEPGDPQRPPIDLLRPFPAEYMRVWKVSPSVNYSKNNYPGLIDPIA